MTSFPCTIGCKLSCVQSCPYCICCNLRACHWTKAHCQFSCTSGRSVLHPRQRMLVLVKINASRSWKNTRYSHWKLIYFNGAEALLKRRESSVNLERSHPGLPLFFFNNFFLSATVQHAGCSGLPELTYLVMAKPHGTRVMDPDPPTSKRANRRTYLRQGSWIPRARASCSVVENND